MSVFVKYEKKQREFAFKKSLTIEDIIKQAGLSPSVVLADLNGKIVPVETKVSDKDTIRLLKIVSGG